MHINIAIDGPAGAGKSTISRRLAKELGYLYVDTGALYRAIGLYALEEGIAPADAEAVTGLLKGLDIQLRHIAGEQRVFLNGKDVSDRIRDNQVSMAASSVSAVPAVRTFLFGLQKDIAKENNVVMDGRDIGTVVLPDAAVKLFLTASPEDRAKRRYEEYLSKGQEADYEEILKDVKLRDYNDSHRAAAPLKQASDAVLVDTTGNTLEESVFQLTQTVKRLLQKAEEK